MTIAHIQIFIILAQINFPCSKHLLQILLQILEILASILVIYAWRHVHYPKEDSIKVIQETHFVTQVNGCVALPWHFEFYILKCKIFLINFLDELGNFKQKKFTLWNVKFFYILKQWTQYFKFPLFYLYQFFLNFPIRNFLVCKMKEMHEFFLP